MSKKGDDVARLAAELAALPPAERYERLLEFPTDHTFKIIGSAEQGFADAVRLALHELGYDEVDLRLRYSSAARYLAITFDLHVDSGARLVEVYESLQHVPGVRYLL